MKNAKKETEEVVLRYFLEKLPNPPKGRLVKTESPDFILQQSRKHHIGIELTQIYLPLKGKIEKIPELVSELNIAIENKTAKIPLYQKKNLNEYWLVITIDKLDLATHTNLPEKLELSVSKTSFNQVWLFDLFSGNLIKI